MLESVAKEYGVCEADHTSCSVRLQAGTFGVEQVPA
jgi:hypothetical protein